MSIGDVNSTARGSGARYNDGKPDLSLIPLCLLEGEARVWMQGAKKYARNNWMKGMQWSVPLASLMRHLSAWQSGEDFDPETGEHHLDHASCNIRMLRLYADTYREGDDRPKEWLQIKAARALDMVSMEPPVIASPTATREARGDYVLADEHPAAYRDALDSISAATHKNPPKWSPAWGLGTTGFPAPKRHPMQAEAIRDHDERLNGAEDRL